MTFQLDTSGAIRLVPAASDPDGPICRWDDLTPFTKGYIEALFADIEYPAAQDTAYLPKGFSDLAPETLARIIADCEAAIRDGYDNTVPAGSTFYAEREEGYEPGFPPLTVQLGDDGKVRFA